VADLPTIARVLCDRSGPDRAFDYQIPADLADQVSVGSVVRIDLHGRRIGGWIRELDPVDASPHEDLLPLRRVSGVGPDEEVSELAEWAAHRWAGRRSQFFRAASPLQVIRTIGTATYSGIHPEPRSPATAKLLEAGGGVLRLPPTSDVLPSVWSCLTRGPVLVIVPGVDDAAILHSRMSRAGVSTALLPKDWARAAAGVDVSIGTRTAAFARLPKVGSIIVIDEFDERLQSESSPTWHAREVVSERAARVGVPLVLVSAVPTPEGLSSGVVIAPSRERETAGWPEIVVSDLADADGPRVGRLSSAVIEELREPSRRVLCVINRTGTSRLLSCRNCRELASCEECESLMSQPSEHELYCAKCGSHRPLLCRGCSGMSFSNLRPGTARLVKELGAAAGRPAVLVEGDSYPDWSSGSTDVLVGTEALLHRVHHADTVVFLDVDSELFAPRFRAGEHLLGLLARAARVVGRKSDGGRLILQTKHPDHGVLAAMGEVDIGAATEAERVHREQLHLPPYGALAIIEGSSAGDFVSTLPATVRSGGSGDKRQVRGVNAEVLADALAFGQRPTKGKLRVAVNPGR